MKYPFSHYVVFCLCIPFVLPILLFVALMALTTNLMEIIEDVGHELMDKLGL